MSDSVIIHKTLLGAYWIKKHKQVCLWGTGGERRETAEERWNSVKVCACEHVCGCVRGVLVWDSQSMELNNHSLREREIGRERPEMGVLKWKCLRLIFESSSNKKRKYECMCVHLPACVCTSHQWFGLSCLIPKKIPSFLWSNILFCQSLLKSTLNGRH